MARPQEALMSDFIEILGPSFRNILGSNSRFSSGSSPERSMTRFPIDIVNEEKTIYIYAEIPGVEKESIDIDIYNNKLTITSEKNRPYENPGMSEIKFGKYERTITLPICITKKEAVSVTYNNGILKIKINKLVEEENRFTVRL